MQLIIVAGNLGSGKTTLIIRLAKKALNDGIKVAVLVNEIGEIGIDNQHMKQLDLNVYEILGGCICCTLSADLPLILEKLAAEYAPELVIMEPSGAADPGNLMAGLEKYLERTLECYRVIALLDPLRLPMFMEVLTPLTTSLIRNADLIVINKTDIASQQELDEALRIVRVIKGETEVYYHSVKKELHTQLLSGLLSCQK